MKGFTGNRIRVAAFWTTGYRSQNRWRVSIIATRHCYRRSVAAVAIAGLLLLPLAAWSGGVVTTCTESNLRTAMAGGGTVTFACAGTIKLTSTITNAVNTTLDASGRQITISGGNAVRVFYIATNTTFTLVNLAVADGNAVRGAGIFNEGGNLVLLGTVFRTNTTKMGIEWDSFRLIGCGGGILNHGGAVNATNCTFMGNRAQTLVARGDPGFWDIVGGGAIYSTGGQISLHQCDFIDNHATGSPGFSATAGGSMPSPGNPGFGAAIYNAGGLILHDCAFVQNSALGGLGGTPPPPSGYYPGFPGAPGGNADGGALWNSGTLSVHNCSFANNSTTGGGGGTGGPGGWNGSFGEDGGDGGPGGVARGGALFNSGTASLANCSFGPGLAAVGGNAGDAANGVSTTYAGGGGAGGIGGSGSGSALFNLGTMMMVNCTVSSNAVTGGGGGDGGAGGAGGKSSGNGGNGANGGASLGTIWNADSLVNCTIASNFANPSLGGAGGAGGTWSYPSPHTNSPGVAGNNGSAIGGISGGATLRNTILAGNALGNCAGGLGDAGHNISSDATCAFSSAGSLNNTDPKLGPLADNGGPTLTMALLAGSPAIDGGDIAAAPPTDQRGAPRPFGAGADIGAYEYAAMLSISRASGNGLDILLRDGSPGQTCRLLTSTDFLDWVCVATNQVGASGTFLFRENCSTAELQRFYKAVLP